MDSHYYSKWEIAIRLWASTSAAISVGVLVFSVVSDPSMWWIAFLVFIAGLCVSLPALIALPFVLQWLAGAHASAETKFMRLIVVCLIIDLLYVIPVGLAAFISSGGRSLQEPLGIGGLITAILFAGSSIAAVCYHRHIKEYFKAEGDTSTIQSNKMETTTSTEPSSNKTLFKGLITAALILFMLIPTVFVQNLIEEREARQKEVAQEVSSRWSSSQTLSGPFLYVPYRTFATDAQGKSYEVTKHLWVLPENLNVSGSIAHQIRLRSIYKVLLYRSELNNQGSFRLAFPKEIEPATIQWQDARVCYALSDFKGIEERMLIDLDGVTTELSPGLPAKDIAETGLSAPLNLAGTDIGRDIPFRSVVKIKGSGRLHFMPFAGNSTFTLSSSWPSPSFDGNNLPSERNVGDTGFTATWVFNKANLPFGTTLENPSADIEKLAFGVTMVQPADQYAKAQRTVKYAILIIGLTFSLFFIVEIMQKRPVHPVQYVLIGLALVIFYTLLLSVSEFLSFDYAYLLATLATIMLITLYAKSHFRSWRSAGIFAGVLTLLYGFIFVLIRLEDTALLIGSIGLFIILAIAMYASRNVNWYGTPQFREAGN